MQVRHMRVIRVLSGREREVDETQMNLKQQLGSDPFQKNV